MTRHSLRDRQVLLRCARPVLLLLLLCAGSLPPPRALAQEAGPPPTAEPIRPFALEQNTPNPVDPDTWIPFYLDDSLFDGKDRVPVTIRIYNVLRQVVAIPEWIDASGKRQRIINLGFREPGRKLAYWDGKTLAGRRVPEGVYYYQLVVGDHTDRPLTRKLTVYKRRRRGLLPWFGNH
jgi:hypothetical protein